MKTGTGARRVPVPVLALVLVLLPVLLLVLFLKLEARLRPATSTKSPTKKTTGRVRSLRFPASPVLQMFTFLLGFDCRVSPLSCPSEGLEDFINMGLSQAPAGDPRVLLRSSKHMLKFSMAQRNLCASRIQRAFRAHSLPQKGVPFGMRNYMHRWYNPYTGALRRRAVPLLTSMAPPSTAAAQAAAAASSAGGPARGWLHEVASAAHRTRATSEAAEPPEAAVDEEDLVKMAEDEAAAKAEAAKSEPTVKAAAAVPLATGFAIGSPPAAEPLAVVLTSLSQIYLAKLRCDRADDKQGRPHQAMCEFVYDHYMQLFGVREIAERELHQLFA